MISFVAFLSWFLSFCLEARGSFRGFRYRAELKTLFGLLAFKASADLITFLIYVYAPNAYPWASWVSWAGHSLILCFLGCQVCGRLLAEKNQAAVTIYAAVLALVAGTVAAVVFAQGETLKDRLLDGSIAADCMIFGLIVLAWTTKRRGLDRHWNMIAAGIVVQVGWELAVTFCWQYWDGARHLLPIGELSALILWNYAVRSETVVRQGLGVVCEPTETIKARIV